MTFFTDIATARRRRARAATLLADAPHRDELGWPDLLTVPDWAFLARADLDALAWAAGAWLRAEALRRCIDGRVHAALRARLGDAGFAALMNTPPPTTTAAPATGAVAALPPIGNANALEAWLETSGRECLMAGLDTAALRRSLRGLWWPADTFTPMSVPRDVARAALGAALAHRPSRTQPTAEHPLAA